MKTTLPGIFSSRQGFVFLILCSFSTFDADPVLALPGMNLNICESGIYEQLLKFFSRRIKEMIIPDILFSRSVRFPFW